MEWPKYEVSEETEKVQQKLSQMENFVEDLVRGFRQKFSSVFGLRQLRDELMSREEKDEQVWRKSFQTMLAGVDGEVSRLFVYDGVDNLQVVRVVRVEGVKERYRTFSWKLTSSLLTRLEDVSELKPGNSPRLFVEVPFGAPTQEEMNELYQQLKTHLPLYWVAGVFPMGFSPVAEVGEELYLGEMDHHSGNISAHGVVMPTSRWAVVTRYEGEKEALGELPGLEDSYQSVKFWGVTSDPAWEPDLSAREGTLRNPELLEAPTPEEEAFLKGQEESVHWTRAMIGE